MLLQTLTAFAIAFAGYTATEPRGLTLTNRRRVQRGINLAIWIVVFALILNGLLPTAAEVYGVPHLPGAAFPE